MTVLETALLPLEDSPTRSGKTADLGIISQSLRRVNGKVMDVFTLTGFDKKLNISAD